MLLPRLSRTAVLATLLGGSLLLGSGCAGFKERLSEEWEAVKRDFAMGTRPALPPPGSHYKPRVVDPRPLIGDPYRPSTDVAALPERADPIPQAAPAAASPRAATLPTYAKAEPVAPVPAAAPTIAPPPEATFAIADTPPEPKPEPRTYKVKRGDTLGHIAQKMYGKASRWKTIFEANRDKLRNANTIRVGQVLTIP